MNPINFELKSEVEQDIIINKYKNFLNSLPCNIQILIRIREVNFDDYKENFHASKQFNLAKNINQSTYLNFIRRHLSANKILTRKFYLVISSDIKLENSENQLNLNCEIISKNLNKVGIKNKRLTTLELINLFHSYYSPDSYKFFPLTKELISSNKYSYI
ncbi:MAG TPA: hypothetical protein VLF63_02150 [Patescibacteria group bacterium]|nr:hypothetical protein [Patescibacteria group bacterium]